MESNEEKNEADSDFEVNIDVEDNNSTKKKE
jgi:hypothetical protein